MAGCTRPTPSAGTLKYDLSAFASRIDAIAAIRAVQPDRQEDGAEGGNSHPALLGSRCPAKPLHLRRGPGAELSGSRMAGWRGWPSTGEGCSWLRADGSPGGGGGLYSFDGNNASRQGVLPEVSRWADDHPAGLAVFDGLLYLGMARSGRIYASDGSACWEAYSLEQG